MVSAQEEDFPALRGLYLCHTLPGRTPDRFFFSFMPMGYRLHSAPAFSPRCQEVYFSLQVEHRHLAEPG